MPTYQQLIGAKEDELRLAQAALRRANEKLKDMRATISGGADIAFDTVQEAIAARDELAVKADRLDADLQVLRAEQAEDDRIAELREQPSIPTGVTRGAKTMTASVHVLGEPGTYRRDAAPDQPTFLADLFKAQVRGDSQAHERLARHGAEVERSMNLRAGVDTSMVPSFVPPTWLQELVAEYARPSRPIADLVSNLPLPETGMTVNVPKITEPTAVGVQSAQNAPVEDSEPEDETIACPITTIGGSVDVSWQALERGHLVQELIFKDLGRAYGAAIDAQVIGALDAATGVNAITWTETSPTVVMCYSKIADAIGKVRANRYASPSAVVLSPRMWAWLTAATSDSDDRPWIVPAPAGPTNAGGVTGPMNGDGHVGWLQGLPVVIDAQLPQNLGTGTNQDEIYVASFDDVILFEDRTKAPMQLRFDAPGAKSLTSVLLAYGYSAVTAMRQPKAISRITGTGCIVPAL